MFKIIKWIVLAVILLLIIGGLIFFFSLNGIVRSTVETQASSSTNLKTTLGGADVSIFGGKVSLSNLAVGSPAGFSAPQMLSLNGIDVGVKYGQLRDDPIRVAEIRITNPTFVIEQSGGKLNVNAAMDQMPKSEPKPVPTGKREPGEPIKLIIDHLAITNTSITIKPGDLPGLGAVKDYTLTLPTVDMKDIGTAEGNKNGAAIKDVLMLIMKELTRAAADSPQLPPELRQLLHLNVDQMAAQLKERAQAEIGKAIGGQLGETVGNIVKNPKQATSNPADLIQQGIGAFGSKKKTGPATQPSR